jgi:hypothetical protein
MANFPDLVYPDWLNKLLQPRPGATVGESGLIGAHQVGRDSWLKNGFGTKFADLEQFGIGAETTSNGETLAQSKRGGAVLGATNHDGTHPQALNDAQYDKTGQRRTVLNELQDKLAAIRADTDLSPNQKTRAQRKVAREFYIYAGVKLKRNTLHQ